jgi:hypothetical protein
MTTWALLAPAPAIAVPTPAVSVPTPAVPVRTPVPSPAVAVPTLVPSPTAAPEARPVSQLLTDFQQLYRKAEQATETYNTTTERLKKQQAEVARLDRQLVRVRLDLQTSRGAAGRLARQQYQGSTEVFPYVRLLLAHDPQHALDAGHLIGRLTRERAAVVHRLTDAVKNAGTVARAARKALDDQLTLTDQQQNARDDVEQRVKDIEKLLASLTAQQIAALAEAERKTATTAPRPTGTPCPTGAPCLNGPQAPVSDAR